MTCRLKFHNPNAFYNNPCINIQNVGALEVITVGPLQNDGDQPCDASMLLWYGPPALFLTSTTATPLALSPGPYVAPPNPTSNPNNNMLVDELIYPPNAGNWSCGPLTPLSGSFSLFAQGIVPGVPPSWNPTNPVNALNNVHIVAPTVAFSVGRSAAGEKRVAPAPAIGQDVYFAMGLIHGHQGAKKTRLLVEVLTHVGEKLSGFPAIEHLLENGEPRPPEEVALMLGNEHIVPPKGLRSGPIRLQYTGAILGETAKRLRATEPMKETLLDLESGELGQGIVYVKKRKATDWCVVTVRHELCSDGSPLGGLTLVLKN